MSNMKGGFSTLNRWFGRKKDKSGVASAASNGKLSKSTTQLHHMSTDTGMHINEASQLDYNRITPLPAATSNAPFEQTFRITVLLPKDQLYVTRLGARVPLSKLLSLVCDNKQLDADKYEFRNPVDSSQVYSCESSIGAVGLSEIRLCHKSESYDSFNTDSMLKFQRTAAARDSLSSSSDFSSSRHSQSKLTAKTPSPYSSSNSLNSMDSTGMNYMRTPVVPPKALAPPPRKKRVAPRPPSQLVIPEQSVPQYALTPTSMTSPTEPAYAVIVKRPQLCMSTPNLASTPELEMEMETETEPSLELDCNGNSAKTPDAADASGHYATLELKSMNGLPEPTPRKRLLQIKKKAAPAPPPAADTISLTSTTASITMEMIPVTPQPAPRITTPVPAAMNTSMAIPLPQTPPPPLPTSAAPQIANQNVSKVLLNRTPTPEPRSLSSATEEEDNNDTASKQADSGIGEPVPSPSPLASSSPSPEPEPEMEVEMESKATHLESSSDDEEAIKVYNFKTSCQTSVKTDELPAQPTTLAELSVLTAQQDEADEDELTSNGQPSPGNAALATPTSASELTSLSSWNYAVPISPPPDFSDLRATKINAQSHSNASSPLDEIVDELSTIIQKQRLDTLIRQAPEQGQIEAAKPNRLANFSIAAISNGNGHARTNSSSTSSSSHPSPTHITRADSFQAMDQSRRNSLGLRLRSSSQLSLNKIEQNNVGSLQQRRSSSELSIAESPSLQSLELIKTIISNSRKNSLADNPDSPQKQPLQLQLEQSEKPKSSPIPAAATPVTTNVATRMDPPVPELVSKRVIAPVPTVVSDPVPAPTPEPTPLSQPVTTPVPAAKPESTVTTIVSTPINASVPAVATIKAISIEKPQSIPTPAEPTPVPVVKTEKPLPPTYRYSGPPSINFATWSERPKSQVAIKNEGDYIYGGATTATATTPTPTPPPSTPVKLTIEVASPILRMGIPRKEYHVPITVKPLRDVSQEREKDVDQKLEKVKEEVKEQEQEPTLRELVKPSTLPRPAKSNRFTLPAGAPITITTTSSNSLPRPVSNLEKAATVTTTSSSEPAPAPFGQNTLRRTGFKERMLAKEQQEKEQALRVRVSVNGNTTPTPITTTKTTMTPASPPAAAAKPTHLKSSKLELKLQTETKEETKAETAILQVKLRPTSIQMANKSAATPSPPPPPAPPVLTKAKMPASRNVGVVTPTSPDPRSQLLDAIRNFKRDELHHA